MKIKNLIAVAALLLGSTSVSAQTYADGNLRYETDGTNATITGFVASHEVAALEIPATVKDPVIANKTYNVTAIGANAFTGKTIITSVTINDANVAQIGGGAFAGCSNLATVTIGKSVKTISNFVADGYTAVGNGITLTSGETYYTSSTGAGAFVSDGTEVADGTNYFEYDPAIAGAFEGCAKLTTVNFNSRGNSDPVLTIDGGTFVGTGIATLDLTGSKVEEVNQWFEELNTTLTTVTLPASLKGINPFAFSELATLATVDFTACTTTDFYIGAYAFNGAPLIKTLELPAKLSTLGDYALAGSNIQSLTINSNTGSSLPNQYIGDQSGASKLTTLVVKGEFKGQIVGPFATLTSVTFEGKVSQAGALAAGAFVYCEKLATVTFKGKLVAGAVAAGAFGDGTDHAGDANTAVAGIQLTVNYSPAKADEVANAFDPNAFDTSDAIQWVKLATTTSYAASISKPDAVKLSAAEATFALKVASNGESKWYYAKLFAGDDYKIAKKQGDATVVVYGAYVDESDATIYMQNLQIIEGAYWVPAGEAVIVKSSANADVVMTNSSDYSSVMSNAYGPSNEIYPIYAKTTGLAAKDAVAPLYVPYMIAPFADYGFTWSKFKDERVLQDGLYNPTTGITTADFLIDCPVISSARINVVWLDGSEETTAIQTVKSADAENGAIYNLAGQKVSASYKGVVIKDGKKMIQK